MGPRTWPEDWERRRAGGGCPMCAAGRPDEEDGGVRFFAGAVADGYLQRAGPARGYTIVVWRGRHVADPIELQPDEAASYWLEVLTVARAVDRVFTPCQLNYDVLGNAVPHVHTHIVPRYVDDPAPNQPLKPWILVPVPPQELAVQAQRLRDAVTVP